MATPVSLTWANTMNIPLSGVSFADQFKEFLWTFKETLKSAGHSITNSHTGNTGTAGAGDNWTTASSIDLGGTYTLPLTDNGTNGAFTGPWITGSTPVGWLPGGQVIYWLLAAYSNTLGSGDFRFRISNLPYAGGTNALAPDASALSLEVDLNVSGDAAFSWSTLTAGRLATWSTSRGDICLGSKGVGNPFSGFWILRSNSGTGLNEGSGNLRFGLYGRQTASVTIDAITTNNLTTASYWLGMNEGATAAVSPNLAMPGNSFDSLWTAGTDSSGNTLKGPILQGISSASDGRILGLVKDMYSAPANYPLFGVDDSESAQNPRFMKVGGGLWLPVDPIYVGAIE